MNEPQWIPFKKGELPAFNDDGIYPIQWDTMESVIDSMDLLPLDDTGPPNSGYKHKHRRERVVTKADRNAFRNRTEKRRKREKNRRKQAKSQKK